MAEAASRKPALLALPGEIRLQILEEVIAVRHPPVSPAHCDERVVYQPYDPLCMRNTNIYVERHPHTKKAQMMSLLGTNRQLRDETRYIAEHLPPRPYHLDVMFVYGFGLIPTWTSLPRLMESIAKLRIHFRIFDFPDGTVPRWIWRARGGHTMDSISSTTVFLTQYVLRTCYLPGPLHVEQAPSELSIKDHITPSCAVRCITTTVEHVTTPTILRDDDFGHHIFSQGHRWPPSDWQSPSLLNAPSTATYKLATHLAFSIEAMVQCDHSILYGPLLLTNVGKVDIVVDGKTYREFDITGQFWNAFADNESTAGHWVVTAAEKRRRLGMGRTS